MYQLEYVPSIHAICISVCVEVEQYKGDFDFVRVSEHNLHIQSHQFYMLEELSGESWL
jgi:hypothetical protein